MDDMLKAIKQRRMGLISKKTESSAPKNFGKTSSMIDQISSMSEDEKKEVLKLLGISEQSQNDDKPKKTAQYLEDEKNKMQKEMINTRVKELEDDLAYGDMPESNDGTVEVDNDELLMKSAKAMVDNRFLRNNDMKPRNLHERVQMDLAKMINSRGNK